jgi:hypothetical protein
MKKSLALLFDIFFFGTILIIALFIATLGLTQKINNQSYGIKATVVKQAVPVLTSTGGIVKTIYVKPGQVVKKGDPLVDMENPDLKNKITILEQYKNNISAQTEAQVGQEQLKGLHITASTDGIVKEISISEGSILENLSKVMTIYSNNNVQLFVGLSIQQYKDATAMKEIRAYDARLNKTFFIKTYALNPDQEDDLKTNTKKLGVLFKLSNQKDAIVLLNNEDLSLYIENSDEKNNMLLNTIVTFWNKILLKDVYASSK